MTSELQKVEAAIFGSAAVDKADYLRWARSSDLATQARARHLSVYGWERISPEPTMEEECEVMFSYFLTCISQDPNPDDFIDSGYTAAHDLAFSLKHLGGIAGTSGIIAGVAKKLELLYRECDSEGRDRIRCGALEHILEAPGLRPYFEHWARDPVLHAAHESALEWGLAHTGGDAG